MPKHYGKSKKKSSHNRKMKSGGSGTKAIAPDGSIGGKKVTTPRTRRPVPSKYKG